MDAETLERIISIACGSERIADGLLQAYQIGIFVSCGRKGPALPVDAVRRKAERVPENPPQIALTSYICAADADNEVLLVRSRLPEPGYSPKLREHRQG